MLKCSECGCDLTEQEALVHKDGDGERRIICRSCFQRVTGVDYDTFAFRRENAKQTIWAVLFCLAATVYAFAEKGPLFGVLGLLLTALVYLFASKAK